ncbi:gephyrin-like molybdotransferase receptor GlpR [Pseudofrankia sp. BMG5.36]|uniref:gephyrin-like molybdotransferase receptor GlpR n=1 Tax=Pseudofrankia sp. BMG5.36 TaxID=1834512 RepID=UPI0008DB062D|nr:gephyrin-like molybdotransferase receptor GlpR [Pseudofrankia sp. BMG5.36]OHV42892.1 hypothetical protein BCD48_29255 [Pseudofrankia sp. BMG5.36]
MSALIWLAIVGVWGFVLIPMWLRHHDGALEQRSADRFSTAMRVLSRRGGRAQPAPAAASGVVDAGDADPAGRREAENVDEATDADDQMVGTDDQMVGMASDDVAAPAVRGESRASRDGQVVDVPSFARLGGAADGASVSRLPGPGLDSGLAGPARSGRPAANGGTASGRRPGQGRGPGGQVAPPRADTPVADSFGRGEPDETVHTVAVGPTRPVPPARTADPRRRALLRLRRQRLGVLLAAVPITVGLAAGLAGMWIVVQMLVDVGLVIYVAHLRRSTRAERRLAASRAARDRRIAAERAARRASRSASPVPPSRATASRGSAGLAGGRAAGETSSARMTSPASTGKMPPPSHPAAAHGAEFSDRFSDSDPAGSDLAGRPRVPSDQAGRLASPEYAPVRLSGDDGRPLTEEELATAHAQTVDLGGYAAAASAVTPGGAEGSPPAGGQDEGYTNNVRVTGTRPAGRPNARPPTSRPGRVQVNPPGTHGGLTAPPAAGGGVASPPGVASASVVSPGSTGVPSDGQSSGGHEEEGGAVRVLRPAVGS